MKTKFGILTLAMALVLTTAVSGQTKEEKEVSAAVEQLRKALVDPDAAALDRLSDNALTYGHSTGRLENKKEFIDNLVNGNSDFLSIELTDQTVVVSGNTAIVRHVLKGDNHDKGKDPGKVNIAVLTVWQKKNGQWKMLARQAVKLG
jgi:ketosteroid isomerase-like protein